MIDKISKLLALAEGASTQAEAEACFAKAQALASAHAISIAEARILGRESQRRVTPIHKSITVGAPRKRANKHLILLMSAISRVNDVQMNIASNSTYVVLFGFPADIEICETLWIHTSHQMVLFGEQYLASDSWRSLPTAPGGPGISSGQSGVTKQTARSSYYEGFVSSLAERLRVVRREEVAAAEARNAAASAARATSGQGRESEPNPAAGQNSESGGTTTALALQAKAVEVRNYYQENSTARGTWGGGRRPTRQAPNAREAGRRDGTRVRLSKSAELDGGPKQLAHHGR